MSGYRLSVLMCLLAGGGLAFAPSPADAALQATQSPTRVEWQELQPPSSPPATVNAAMAYDVKNDLIVMAGGDFRGPGSDQTWLFDGNTWSQPKLTVKPDYRAAASMAYDANRQETVAGALVLVGSGV